MKLNLSKRHNEVFFAYLFLLPNLLGFLVFILFPVISSFILSFVKYQALSFNWPLNIKFVGLDNFIKLLGFHYEAGILKANDEYFWKYLWNTIYLMAAIPVQMASSLILALVLNKKRRGVIFYRTVFFLPTMCQGVAIVLLWKWIYNYDYGLLNTFIVNIGNFLNLHLEGIRWLSVKRIKPAMILMGVWTYVGGYNMILYLAALQGIPRELYEVAEIDGANGWQKFWAVTWPMISPTTFFIAIMSVIGGFQAGFMVAYILTRGGPHGASTTLMYYIYSNFYSWHNFGYASCIAWFMFLLIFLATMINWRYGGRVVHY